MKTIFENHSTLVEHGVTYNTATATPLATEVVCENITRTLCRTKRGKWFFLSQIENMAGGIQPVTAIEVVVWLHGQGLPRLIGKYFQESQDVRDLYEGRVRIFSQTIKAIAKQEKHNNQTGQENE